MESFYGRYWLRNSPPLTPIHTYDYIYHQRHLFCLSCTLLSYRSKLSYGCMVMATWAHGRICLWLSQGIRPVTVGHTSYCVLIYGRIMLVANRWKTVLNLWWFTVLGAIIMWNRILQWLKQNINQSLNSQNTSHNSPSRASYGLSFVRILGENRKHHASQMAIDILHNHRKFNTLRSGATSQNMLVAVTGHQASHCGAYIILYADVWQNYACCK